MKKLCRLSWNTNNWVTPSPKVWSPKNVSKEGKSHEQKFGYAHEDWLFNPMFSKNGYQYGFIEGLDARRQSSYDKIEEIHFFTISDIDRTRYYLGYIKNAECIGLNHPERNEIVRWIKTFNRDMAMDVKLAGGNYVKFSQLGQAPNVKFSVNNIHLLSVPREINDKIFIRNYARYSAIDLTPKLQKMLNSNTVRSTGFVFTPGKSKHSKDHFYKNYSSGSQKIIFKVHNKILTALNSYLKIHDGIKESDISLEKTTVDGYIVDLIYRKNSSFVIFEVKTSRSIRDNIRDAVGQLLDYSNWQKINKVEKIVVVAPNKLDQHANQYLKRLQSTINIKIEYWQYDATKSEHTKAFIKHT